ncbi:S1 family peptidase [Actinoplanes sp. CA-030573]|uniref:S1 family peptidase n=1 Tax=Actinoplanes sp. CA-030573 TaxID=3239898 RepID=UPI003D8D780A
MSRTYLVRLLTAAASIVVPAALVVVPAAPAAAVAHGDRVAAGRYRFATKLTMTGIPTGGGETRDSWCSGALVAPRWVITAGHCFRDAAGRRVSETVARRTVASVGGHDVPVVAAHQAPGYDVALAELATPVTDVTPIRLGTGAPREGEIVRLLGFGLASGDESAGSPGLRTGRFVVDRVGDTLLDISGREPRADTSACPHDSGGPYFTESRGGTAVLVAVVSTGPACPHPGADFAARTDRLGDWITDTTAGGRGLSFGWAAVPLLIALAALIIRRRRSGARRTAPRTAPDDHPARLLVSPRR